MVRCFTHMKDNIGSCKWCGKLLCEKCNYIEKAEGKLFCESCNYKVSTMERATIPLAETRRQRDIRERENIQVKQRQIQAETEKGSKVGFGAFRLDVY